MNETETIKPQSIATPEAERRLSSLGPREAARVLRLDGDHGAMARLKALGLCVGRRIELVKAGDPLIVRVVGSRVGLSARLASKVFVEPA